MIHLLSVLAKYPMIAKAVPVLQKYQDLTVNDIDGPILRELAGSLGVKMSGDDQAVAHVAAMLKGDAINNFADLANNPETISKLMDWLNSSPETTDVFTTPNLGHFYGALSAEDLT